MNLKKKKILKAASRPPLPIQLIILPTIIKVWQLDFHFINPILGTDSGLTNTSGVLILPGVVLVPLSLIRIFNLVENSSVNCQWFVPFNVYNYDNKKFNVSFSFCIVTVNDTHSFYKNEQIFYLSLKINKSKSITKGTIPTC